MATHKTMELNDRISNLPTSGVPRCLKFPSKNGGPITQRDLTYQIPDLEHTPHVRVLKVWELVLKRNCWGLFTLEFPKLTWPWNVLSHRIDVSRNWTPRDTDWEILIHNKNKQTIQFLKWAGDLHRPRTKEDTRMARDHMKTRSTWYGAREVKLNSRTALHAYQNGPDPKHRHHRILVMSWRDRNSCALLVGLRRVQPVQRTVSYKTKCDWATVLCGIYRVVENLSPHRYLLVDVYSSFFRSCQNEEETQWASVDERINCCISRQ